MLYNVLIAFGEIEWFKSFSSGQYAFVGFRSVEEARRAKDGLQGKLFNDPRIQILYSNVQIDLMDDPTINSTFMTPSLPRVSPSPSSSGLQFGSVQRFGPVRTIYSTNPLHVTETRRNVYLPTPALTVRKFSDHLKKNSPAPGNRRPLPISAVDANVSQRKSKKTRIDEGLPTTGASDTSKPIPDKMSSGPKINGEVSSQVNTGSDNEIMGETGTSGSNININGSPDQFAVVRGRTLASDTSKPIPDKMSSGAKNIGPRSNGEVSSHVNTGSDNQIMCETKNIKINGSPDQFAVGPGLTLVPTSPARTDQEECHGGVEESCCWQGTIAKGGYTVCNTRCISIGKGIESKFPEVLNCSAKTDLDMLTKHSYEAVSFGLYYFVPQRDQDAHAYQEILHYMSSKNRSCVAKFSDGTPMFLVPPSHFSEHVLNVPHRNHFFGVVLKFQPKTGNAMEQSTVLSVNPLQQFSVSTQMTIKEDRTQFPYALSSSINTVERTVKWSAAFENIQSLVASQHKSEPVQGGLGSLPTLLSHLQELRSGTEPPGHGHESLESVEDKYRRYQATSELVANILTQLSQKEQQANIVSTQHQP